MAQKICSVKVAKLIPEIFSTYRDNEPKTSETYQLRFSKKIPFENWVQPRNKVSSKLLPSQDDI